MPIVRHDSEANQCEGGAIVAYVLSPFDVHRFVPRKLRPRYFHSAAGNVCRGLSGYLERFGNGMSRCLSVSYSCFRHLWLAAIVAGGRCRKAVESAAGCLRRFRIIPAQPGAGVLHHCSAMLRRAGGIKTTSHFVEKIRQSAEFSVCCSAKSCRAIPPAT